MGEQRYVGICPVCDVPLHVQAMVVETVVGLTHQVCALQLQNAVTRDLLEDDDGESD